MISYQDYLNLLKEKNIELYDFQKRISYFRLQNLLESSNSSDQIGGGSNFIYQNKLLSLEKHNLEKVITLLNYKNFEMVKTILNNIN
jgi:hypothetical protein